MLLIIERYACIICSIILHSREVFILKALGYFYVRTEVKLYTIYPFGGSGAYREMDLLTYLRTYEPQEMVHFGAALTAPVSTTAWKSPMANGAGFPVGSAAILC